MSVTLNILNLSCKQMNHLIPKPATVADAALIQQLANQIWYDYYPTIITVAQIDYMLETLYSVDKLVADIAKQRIIFTLFESQQQAVGFLGCILKPEQVFVNQLYLDIAYHGRGWGQQMLCYAEQFAQQHQRSQLSLRVNKNNIKAIQAYERAGFKQVDSLCTDIGNGFMMDDYVMCRIL